MQNPVRPASAVPRYIAVSLALCLSSALFLVLWYIASWLAAHALVNRILWALLGPPMDLYGFMNLMLPRLMTLVFILVPTCLVGVLSYDVLSRGPCRFTLRQLLILTAILAVLASFASGSTGMAKRGLFFPFVIILSCSLYLALRMRRNPKRVTKTERDGPVL